MNEPGRSRHRTLVVLALAGIGVIALTTGGMGIVLKLEEVRDRERLVAIRSQVNDEMRIAGRVLEQDPPATLDATKVLDATEGLLLELDEMTERHSSRLDNPSFLTARSALRRDMAALRSRVTRIVKDGAAIERLTEIVRKRDRARYEEARETIASLESGSWAAARAQALDKLLVRLNSEAKK